MSLFKDKAYLIFALTAFINAFVDLGHKILIQNTIFKTMDGQEQIILSALVNGLILLPFIMMMSPAGFIADKFPKNKVMMFSALAAVVITSLITLFYYLGFFYAALMMTFVLGMQSALYSPAKYGYIKELMGSGNLTSANAGIQMATTTAILLGTLAFSFGFESQIVGLATLNKASILHTLTPLGFLLIALSLVELLFAMRLKKVSDTVSDKTFDWARYRKGQITKNTMKAVHANPVVWLSVLGLAGFWSLSQVILAVFPDHAETVLGINNTVMIQGILACAGIGLVLGSIFVNKVSKGYIETGMIAVGALGVTVASFLVVVITNPALQAINFVLLGFSGALFIVPVNALIQYHTAQDRMGQVLSGSNFIQNIAMVSALVITIIVASYGVSSQCLLAGMAILALVGSLYTVTKLPQSLLRFTISQIIGLRYKLSVIGLEKLPERGGVLLLGNHISWLDWAMVQIASPRPVRFVMDRTIYNKWYLNWLLSRVGIIPISAGGSKGALEVVNKALNAGDVVCLFPEGTISHNGHLGVFQKGFEIAARDAEAVIVPFYLRGLWGTAFSRSGEKLKEDSRGTKDIIMAFGRPLAISSTTVEVKSAIEELTIHSWEQYSDTLPTLGEAIIDRMKADLNKVVISDLLSGDLTARRFLVGAICLSRRIKDKRQNVGLLVPTVNAGAMMNVAALLKGKTLVNLNYTASPESIKAAIEKSDITTIYTSAKFLKKLSAKGFDLTSLEGVTLVELEALSKEISKFMAIVTLLKVSLLPAAWLKKQFCKKRSINDPAALLFSSGSEGSPKGIMLSHKNMMSNIKQIASVLDTRHNDVIMGTLPIFHAFGLTVTTLMPLTEGLRLVVHPDPTDVLNVGKLVAKHEATLFCGTSTFLRLFTRNRKVSPLMLQSLRLVVAGAERLQPDVRDGFEKKFNCPIFEGYGATETTPVASVNIPDRLEMAHWKTQVGNKLGTVGMALPGSAFKIVDPQSLDSLAVGEDGLILIGGTQIMLGYLKDPKKTAEVILEQDGLRWYKSGDKGHLDNDGFLTIVDRYSRFAKLGGEMVSLTAVEDAINGVITQEDVEVLTLNLPDEKKGEKVIALVAGLDDVSTLKSLMIEAKVNPLMIPSEFIAADIPKLGTGKSDVNTAKSLYLSGELGDQ